MSRLLVSALVALIVVLGTGGGSASPALAQAAPPTDCGWRPPVDAPVVDPFRPPEGPYGAGNRGIEYGVTDGAPVRAVADGRVGFRGPVAGRLYLVVHHDGDLRSTYGPLASIDVLRGATVAAGAPVATAAVGFHLTARIGERYIDPGPLLDGTCGPPRLVPPTRLIDRPTGIR
ncbi:MAG: M23 family metallopeptidase [Actinomycetota bacterium]